jgi:hypothetical protein
LVLGRVAKLDGRRDLFDRRQFGFKLLALAAIPGGLCGSQLSLS